MTYNVFSGTLNTVESVNQPGELWLVCSLWRVEQLSQGDLVRVLDRKGSSEGEKAVEGGKQL